TYVRAGSLLARGGFLEAARALLQKLDFPGEGRRVEIARSVLSGEIALAEGRIKDALVQLRRGADLAPPIEPREYLGRGLNMAGRSEEALAEYQRIMTAPAAIWQNGADNSDPGLWTDSMLHVAELNAKIGRKAEANAAVIRFLNFHAQADSDSPRVIAARKLL